MFDRLVADGDRTTTGGFVIARSGMYNENGKQYARKENHATCGNCKGGWPIYGTASDWMDDGLPMVKDYDRVLCPCGKNFVLASAGSSSFYSDSKDQPPSTSPSPILTYGQQYTLRDSHGRPLAHVPYRVIANGEQVMTGTTNASGQTDRILTQKALNLELQLGQWQ